MPTIQLSLKDDVTMTPAENGGLLLLTPISRVELSNLSNGARAVLEALSKTGLTDPAMRALVTEHDGPAGMFAFFQVFPRLVGAGAICYTLMHDDDAVTKLVPISPYFRRNKNDIAPDAQFKLSRFTFLHMEDDEMILESPLGFGRLIIFENELIRLLGLLKTPQSWSAVTLDGLPAEVLHIVFQFLLSIGALTPVEDGVAAETHDEILRQWDFHDLLFHSRTRYGRYDKPFDGSVNRFFGEIKMPPAVKPAMTDAPISLYQPDLDTIRENDPTLASVMEDRRTVYDYDDETPINAEQLGEFLYRVARIRAQYGEDHSDESGYTEYMSYSNRTYPGGGAMYELEFYITVVNCAGLESGLYHYDAEKHQLHMVSEMSPMVIAIISDAAGTTPFGRPPQVVVTLTARFPRMFWKYNTLGYSLILKNVGVLYQSMYLVATAMNLAPVAMGAGNSDLFAQAAGLEYYAETSVGEFSISSRLE